MPQNMSPGRAITVGLLWVNGPVLLCFAVPLLVLELWFPESNSLLLVVFLIVPAFLAGWLWWSFSVARWRLWAYKRVDDIPELKRKAVQAGLTWPDGHFFERTEVKSAEHAALERSLEEQGKQKSQRD